VPAPETAERAQTEALDPSANAPAKSSPETPNNKRMVIKRRPPTPAPNGEALTERKLQIEIYKAIRDRAINGVQVSYVDDGTVYLEGRVATPRQKLAAVRATLGVPGVKGVRDRIVIDY
jgi:osmotically-inducible protein OsmY